MSPSGQFDNLDMGILGNQAAQDNQAGKQVANGNQAELGIQLICLVSQPPGLEGELLVGHQHRVVEGLGRLLVVVASCNPVRGEGTAGVVLMRLQDQGILAVHMEVEGAYWNLGGRR